MASTTGGPRLVISSRDHEALIVLTAVICLTWTILILIVRLYLRLRLNGPFSYDDWAASVATVIAVVQTGFTLDAVHHGIGENAHLLMPGRIDRSLKRLYLASLLYILSICAAKCSMFQLVSRLTRTRSHTLISHAFTAFTGLWGIAALVAAAFQCKAPSPWNITTQQNCPNLFFTWAAIEATSLFIEGLIFALAIWLIWSLQISLRLKVIVVIAFLLRLTIIVPAVFKIILLRKDLPSPNATFTSTNVVIATQVTMHYTVMAATFPCMRAFLQSFNTGFGATIGLTTADSYDSHTYAKGTQASSVGTSNNNISYPFQSVNQSVENAGMMNGAAFSPDHGHTTSITTVTSVRDYRQSVMLPPLPPLHIGQDEPILQESMDLDDSERSPIRKTLEWEIRHELRDMGFL